MRRIGVLVLAFCLAWQIPAPAIAQEAVCGSFAVAVAPQQVGHPLSDFAVQLFDASGEITNIPFGQPGTVTPSPRPGVALLRSLGGIYSLLDIATGAVIPIQIPEDQQARFRPYPALIRNAPGADFMLLADYPAAVWLVDLTNGDALELSTVLPSRGVIDSATIAPGGENLLLFSRAMGYVISLTSIGDPEPLDTGEVLPHPGFSADGASVIYASQGDRDTVAIQSLDLSTGSRTEIGIVSAVHAIGIIPGGTILAFGSQSLSAFLPGDAMTTPMYTWSGAFEGVFADVSGQHLLIGDEVDDRTKWFWVETATGDSTELSELEEMWPLATGSPQNSLFFLPSAGSGAGIPGSPYRTVDLTTGNVSTVLTQDSTEVWNATAGGDSAGRYALVNAVSPGTGRMWLIDTLAGTANLIGSSDGNVIAQVSPDGCQLAMAIFTTIGEGRKSTVTAESIIDGSTWLSEPNSMLLGWANPSPGG